MNWFQDILLPLFDQKLPQPTAPVVVFSADTNCTQSYVFESNRLPEIRGASRQLSSLNRPDVIQDFFRQQGWDERALLYAGGGSVLALLPDENAAQILAKWLSDNYAKRTRIVTISSVWQRFTAQEILSGFAGHPPTSASDVFHQTLLDCFWKHNAEAAPRDHGHFGTVISYMGTLLRRSKGERRIADIEAIPFVEICSACQIRPVQTIRTYADGTLTLCNICEAKRAFGEGNERFYWINRLYSDLRAAYPSTPERNELTYPHDISELTEDRNVALIYADGDGIGERLKLCKSPSEYRDLSATLSQNTQRAVAQALGKVIMPADIERNKLQDNNNDSYILSWEIITIGGDDVLMLVPAWAALNVAVELADTFHRLSENFRLRMSVGFAIGKPATPIRVLYEAARAALKNAKRRSYETIEPCIDFHNFVREGYIGGSLSQNRKQSKVTVDGGLLYGRPYTLREVARLQSSLSRLREGFPRSQLQMLCEELRQSQVRGSLFYDYQRARLKPSLRQILMDIEAQWDSDQFPWLSRKGEIYTILPDLMDLL